MKRKISHEPPQEEMAKMSGILAFTLYRKEIALLGTMQLNLLLNPSKMNTEHMVKVHFLVILSLGGDKPFMSMKL